MLTDSGLGAIVRVGWPDRTVRAFPLPDGTPYANLNSGTFDGDGDLWFTGQSGVIGKLALKSGKVATSAWSSRQRRTRVRAASGATARAASGSVHLGQ